MKNQCNLLFVTYGGGHARMLLPVIVELSKLSNVSISVLALTTAPSELKHLSLNMLRYKDFFGSCKKVKRYGEELIRDMEKVVDYDETISYLGKNYLELVELLGEDGAHDIYKREGRQSFNPEKALEEILTKVNPDVVIATNSPRSERAAIRAARNLGIYSIAMIDMFSIRCENWFSDNNFADKVLVFSDFVKNSLVSKGRSEDSIVVTGNPAFDSLVNHYIMYKDKIEENRAIKPFTVLWASQREPAYLSEVKLYGDVDLPIKVEAVLVDVFTKHPDWCLIVRNHPSEVCREYPKHVRVSNQSDDLLNLLSCVDVVITLTSTVGFQGSILGANFVTIDLSVVTPTMPFSEMGISQGVKSLDEIESVLLSIFQKDSACQKSSYAIENATNNVIKEIL